MFFLVVDRPWLLFAVTFVLLLAAARVGARVRTWKSALTTEEQSDLELVRNATSTLLAVVIGFSLSMAVSRYDLRKTYEEEEANAIGTEYLRLDLMPAENARATRDLLRNYTRLRILFYSSQVPSELQRAEIDTAALQTELWASVSQAAASQPTPVTALAVAGMNDVINSQGYALAAWRNRLPAEPWGLMLFVALTVNFLFGLGARRRMALTVWVLPLTVATAYLLIADTDSPRNGLVRVQPQNLLDVVRSMTPNSP
jgi:hypothetical protein